MALYFKIYNVCLSPPISLVVMATKMLNLRKIFKNQLLRSNKGDKAETFAEMLISIASLNVAIVYVLSLLWTYNGKHENFINCSLISGVLTELFKTSLLSSPPSRRKIL